METDEDRNWREKRKERIHNKNNRGHDNKNREHEGTTAETELETNVLFSAL